MKYGTQEYFDRSPGEIRKAALRGLGIKAAAGLALLASLGTGAYLGRDTEPIRSITYTVSVPFLFIDGFMNGEPVDEPLQEQPPVSIYTTTDANGAVFDFYCHSHDNSYHGHRLDNGANLGNC